MKIKAPTINDNKKWEKCKGILLQHLALANEVLSNNDEKKTLKEICDTLTNVILMKDDFKCDN